MNVKQDMLFVNNERNSWYNGVGDSLVWVWDRRKQLVYVYGSACMAQQNNPTPAFMVNGTECYDSWVWSIYLFFCVLRRLTERNLSLTKNNALLFVIITTAATTLFVTRLFSALNAQTLFACTNTEFVKFFHYHTVTVKYRCTLKVSTPLPHSTNTKSICSQST